MAREHPARYQQVADDLRARMDSGEFMPGSRLPSKAALMGHYSVSLATLNGAISVLRNSGLIETVQGLGMFARKPDTAPSEYDVIMGRLDEISEEVMRLSERLSAAEKALGQSPGQQL